MKKRILRFLVFVISLLFAWGLGGVCLASEYTAKGGEDCAKVAKECDCICSGDELAKMNKIANPRAKLKAGQKLTCLTAKELEHAEKHVEREKNKVSYGTEQYSVFMSAFTDIKNKRIEYAPDEQYPYGIHVDKVLEYAKQWKK